ncbi:Hypothetical_protein [Hexamita inflata]|uniref:Hypothetical_protein n=1 Tax=Hexamita inflata TaxID=28002 RepID=A0AA86R7V9_9EUKA|nr:Hypothetical protein HINF_LOCUS55269 [Hexamita inflata]
MKNVNYKFQCLSAMIYNKMHHQTKLYTSNELIFNVMMQNNVNYSLFWSKLSELAQVSEERLRQVLITLSISTFTQNRLQTITFTQPQNLLKQSVFRQSSESSEMFKQQFIFNMKVVLSKSFKVIQFEHMTQEELCVFIKDNGILNITCFWKQLAELFLNKTTKQIRDYYNKAFQKVLYTQQLTVYDKANLHTLNQIWAEEPPAFIAKKFTLVSEESGYFPQNVIMYVVNLRNNARKQLSVQQDRNQ